VSDGRSLEFPPDPGDGGDVLVVEWVDEVLPDGVLEGPADLKGSSSRPLRCPSPATQLVEDDPGLDPLDANEAMAIGQRG
jgi:hypothetical protein